jgi:hypothetical protein
MSKVSDPQHWRRRAEEARTLADELTDAEEIMRRWRYVPNNEVGSYGVSHSNIETVSGLAADYASGGQP